MKTAIATTTRSDVTARLLISLGGIIAFAVLTGLAAQVRFYLPNNPVPVTLQTTIVLLAGLSLGARLGAASMLLYLALGVAGGQLFALQSETMDLLGWRYFWGPTGGFLVGFLLAQPLVGHLSRQRHFRGALAGTLAGTAMIFAAGLLWLGVWLNAGVVETLEIGLLPFLLPGLIKTLLVLGIAPLALRYLRPVFGPTGQPGT